MDANAKLQQISNDPQKFTLSVVLVLIEHVSIIALAVMWFIVFSPCNLILAIVWTIFRIGEAVIQIYNKITTGVFSS